MNYPKKTRPSRQNMGYHEFMSDLWEMDYVNLNALEPVI